MIIVLDMKIAWDLGYIEEHSHQLMELNHIKWLDYTLIPMPIYYGCYNVPSQLPSYMRIWIVTVDDDDIINLLCQ